MIAQIEPNDYKLRVQQSEAALAQARARWDFRRRHRRRSQRRTNRNSAGKRKAQLDEARLSRERAVQTCRAGNYGEGRFRYRLMRLTKLRRAVIRTRSKRFAIARRCWRSDVQNLRWRDNNWRTRRVYAPIDGIVQEKRASVGEYLAAGAPVVDIVRMNPLRLRAEVPERDAATVRFGQNVRVSVEGDDESLPRPDQAT